MAFIGYLKQSTGVTLVFGPFVDETDGKTAETGLTLSSTDFYLSKNGGAMANPDDTNAGAHDQIGYYTKTVNATDTGTVGKLIIGIHESGALPIRQDYMIVPANIYDSWISGTDILDVSVTQLAGVAQSLTDLKDFADTGYDPSTHKVGTVVIVDTCTSNTDMRGTDSAALAATALDNTTWTDARAGYLDNINGHTAQTGDNYAVVYNGTYGLSIIEPLVDDLESRLSAARAGYLDNLNIGELVTGVSGVTVTNMDQAALAHFFSVDSGTDYASAAAGSVVKEIADNAGGSALTEAGIADAVWDEAVGDHSGAGTFGETIATLSSGVSAADIADAVWDEAIGDHGNSGSFGETISSIIVDTAEIGAAGAGLTGVPWNASWDAEVQSECTDALNAYDPPTKAELDTGLAGLNDISGSDVETACGTALSSYDPPTRAELSTDTTTITTAISGLNDPTAAAIADAVWDETTSGHTTTGTFGESLTDIDTNVDALNNLSASDVNAQVVDALATDTYAEPGTGAPAATASIKDKIGYMYKAWRNKTETTTSAITVYNDDTSTAGQQSSISDDGTTATKGEFGSG